MTKWDYLVVDAAGKQGAELQVVLKQAGQQGWELVAAVAGAGGAPSLLFKRPLAA